MFASLGLTITTATETPGPSVLVILTTGTDVTTQHIYFYGFHSGPHCDSFLFSTFIARKYYEVPCSLTERKICIKLKDYEIVGYEEMTSLVSLADNLLKF